MHACGSPRTCARAVRSSGSLRRRSPTCAAWIAPRSACSSCSTLAAAGHVVALARALSSTRPGNCSTASAESRRPARPTAIRRAPPASLNGCLSPASRPPSASGSRRPSPRPRPPRRRPGRRSPRGEHVLLSAPTGSGKTLAAFLWALDRLSAQGTARERVRSASHARRLRQPPEGARVRHRAQPAGAAERASAPSDVRVGIRTGDTPQRERAAMVRNPPDILITTPESLYLILTSRRARCSAASRR